MIFYGDRKKALIVLHGMNRKSIVIVNVFWKSWWVFYESERMIVRTLGLYLIKVLL